VRDKGLKLEDTRMAKPHTHRKRQKGELRKSSVERGKGIPKERDVNRRREFCEWEG
jgi:hypothetical protein